MFARKNWDQNFLPPDILEANNEVMQDIHYNVGGVQGTYSAVGLLILFENYDRRIGRLISWIVGRESVGGHPAFAVDCDPCHQVWASSLGGDPLVIPFTSRICRERPATSCHPRKTVQELHLGLA